MKNLGEIFILLVLIFNLACEGKKEFNTITRCLEEVTEAGSTCSQEWRITDIDSTDAHPEPDILIDKDNNVHIAVSGKYVTNASGKWEKFNIFTEGSDIWFPSISIDSVGNVHIFAIEVNDEIRTLKHATNASGAWEINTLDLGEEIFGYSAGLDSQDNIYIVYSSKLGGGVNVATNKSGQWEKYFTDEGNLWYIFMDSLIDQKDNLYIAYLDRDFYLIYATNSTGEWEKYVLDKGYCCEDNLFFGILYTRPSIAVSPANHIYINYLSEKYSEYNQPEIDYKYITNASGVWESHSLPTGDFKMPMVIDTTEVLHIAFATGSVHYLTNSSGEWKHYIIEKGEKIGQWDSVDIARDNKNNIYLVYSGEDGTRYATNAP